MRDRDTRGIGARAAPGPGRAILLVPLLILPLLPAVPAGAAPAGVGPLVWSDDFNGVAPDPTKWAIDEPGVWGDYINTPAAVTAGGGVLTIRTYTDPATGQHYSATLGTQDHFLKRYGYFEARVKFNGSPGMWQAFYLQSPTVGRPDLAPAQAGMEIDVAEHRASNDVGGDEQHRYLTALHWGGYGDRHQFIADGHGPFPDLANGTWHTYGVRWTPDGYRFYFDDRLVWAPPPGTPISQRSQYLVLSADVEDGSWAGDIPAGGYGSAALTQTFLEVDSVRVYEAFAGDADSNGRVDLADFGALRAKFGASGSDLGVSDGDFNLDGRIDLADFGLLRANFGARLSGGDVVSESDRAALESFAASVPEPATATAILAAAGWLALARRARPGRRLFRASLTPPDCDVTGRRGFNPPGAGPV